MLVLVRTQTRDLEIKHSLEALLGQITSDVWLGEVPVRVMKQIESMLLIDNTSDSSICRLGRTINVSNFYSIVNGIKKEISFFEIYKNKNLLKNKE